MRILLAIDQSAGSEAAVLEVASRFWEPGTSVRVLHAIEKFVPPAAELWYDADGNLEQASNAIVVRQKRTFEKLASILCELSLDVETVIRIGNAGKCVLNEAREWKADLIVLGSHEHGALTRLLFGSVSRFVCEHAQCSVEVVH